MFTSLIDALASQSETIGNKLFIVDQTKKNEKKQTYGEFKRSVIRVANQFNALGLGLGDRGVIISENSMEYLQAHFGIIAAGGISVPVEPDVSILTLKKIIDDCSPKLLITSEKVYTWLKEAVDQYRFPKFVLSESCGTPSHKGTFDFRPDTNDIAAVMYTTGTTGNPKGVIIRHKNLLETQSNIFQFLNYSDDDREVITLPITHSFGLGHIYSNLLSGGFVILHDGLTKIGRVFKSISTYQATGFPTTPMGVSLLLDRYERVFCEAASSLRFMVVNSAPLSPYLTKRMQMALPKNQIYVYYGLTEASRSTFINLSEKGEKFYQSVGKPFKNVKIRLDKSSDSEFGEILIRGPHVTSGYWNNDQLTKKEIIGGWLRTHDIGSIDEYGYLYIKGRLNDTINVGGYKFHPNEVEVLLKELPGVKDVVLQKFDGDLNTQYRLIAFIEKEPKVQISLPDVTRHCRKKLEHYKIPKEIQFVNQFPRSSTGKIKRGEINCYITD